MKNKKIAAFLLIAQIFICVELSAQITLTRTGAQDIYRVKSALLPKPKTFDFRLSSRMQSTDMRFRVPISAIDSVTIGGTTQMMNLQWALNYAYTENLELSISGVTYYDSNAGVYRYGAGDTRLGIRYASTDLESQFNWSLEGFYTLPTGIDEQDRLVRSFISDKSSWGVATYSDFTWKNWSARINGGFYYAGGIVDEIEDPLQMFWYDNVNGMYGISSRGEKVQSSQANVGVGLNRQFFFNTNIFAEYYSYNVLSRDGKGKSLGNFAAGMTLLQRAGLDLKVGADIPLGTTRPDMGFFLDVRMNGLIGGRRVTVETVPILTEEEPSLVPGRKPFFKREGVVYSRIREPIRDTVFIIDGTPSMLGRGTDPTQRGEEVAKSVIDFIQILIDSSETRSNISLITFDSEVNSLSWRAIDDSKKEEIKNAVRDVPDQMNATTDELELLPDDQVWKERLEEAIARGYEELATFKRADYNKIHLQRIVVFSDGIDDSKVNHDLAPMFNSISRRFLLNRDDFRFMYYMHTNPRTEGAKLDDNIITFVENENGKVFRAIDIANIGEEYVGQLKYNGIENRSTLRYQSQVTKLAMLDINTKGWGNVKQPLIKAFNSVFDYNEYFVVKPQAEIQSVMANEGVLNNKQPELADLVRIGRRLGVDYVMYGEITNFNINREKGIQIPFLIGFPKTELLIEVAIRLIDVAEGTLEFVKTVSASSSRSDGVRLFPTGGKENKMNQLSGVELTELQKKLMEKWSEILRDSMFEDRTVIISN